MAKSINSNFTGLSIAEEVSLRVLPALPVWQDMQPNEYKDLGATMSTVASSPIEPSRQNNKGTVTDLDASGGFGIDMKKSNIFKLFQGFMFAYTRELKTTKPLNGAQVIVTGASAADSSYTAASGLSFAEGEMVMVSGFTTAANNGLKVVSEGTSTKTTVLGALVSEVATSAVFIEKVGVQFSASEASLTVTDGVVAIERASGSFEDIDGIIPGAWVYVGGDSASTRFAEKVGYARIVSVSDTKIVFDQIEGNVTASDEGLGKTVRMFLGKILRNEQNPDNIVSFSYNIERSLGSSDFGPQAEYLEGAMANELSISVPTADKVTADMSYVACGYSTRSGEIDDEKKEGTHLAPPAGELPYNTSSNVPDLALTLYDATRSKQVDLFEYCEGFTFAINNNLTPDKAVSVLGAFDISPGQFDVTVSLDAYFVNVAALSAIRNNADVGANLILAQKNYGTVFDVPLGTVNGGNLNVEKGAKVKTSIELMGAKNQHGYTAQIQAFTYLPNVAMVQA